MRRLEINDGSALFGVLEDWLLSPLAFPLLLLLTLSGIYYLTMFQGKQQSNSAQEVAKLRHFWAERAVFKHLRYHFRRVMQGA